MIGCEVDCCFIFRVDMCVRNALTWDRVVSADAAHFHTHISFDNKVNSISLWSVPVLQLINTHVLMLNNRRTLTARIYIYIWVKFIFAKINKQFGREHE